MVEWKNSKRNEGCGKKKTQKKNCPGKPVASKHRVRGKRGALE